MKHLLYIFSLSLLVTACKKEITEEIPQPLAEQTMMNVAYGTDAAQKMDVYLPAGRTTTTTKAIIIVHGGAWIAGDKADMNSFIPVIKQRLPEYAIFNINYRLGVLPATNIFPTQEADMKTVVNFVLGKATEYKFSADKLSLLGASAGAHLVLLQGYKNASPKVKAIVDLFGPTDMAALNSFYASVPLNQFALQLLMGGSPAANPSIYQSSSPINFVSSQSAPTLILHGIADDVVPIAQSTTLKTKLETAGVYVKMVTYANAGHGDWNAATFEDAYQQIVSFLQLKNP